MDNYKYMILLKDHNENVQHIALSNYDGKTIQNAVDTAKILFEQLKNKDCLPFGIDCEYDYIMYYLHENYDIILADEHLIKEEVYY